MIERTVIFKRGKLECQVPVLFVHQRKGVLCMSHSRGQGVKGSALLKWNITPPKRKGFSLILKALVPLPVSQCNPSVRQTLEFLFL